MTSLPLKLSGRVVIVNDRGEVLLLRRSQRSRHFAGQWEFPGGKGEPHESFADALTREVAEETGLTVELGRVLGADEASLASVRVAFLFLEARLRGVDQQVRLSDEHDDFVWVVPAQLARQEMAAPFQTMAATYAQQSA